MRQEAETGPDAALASPDGPAECWLADLVASARFNAARRELEALAAGDAPGRLAEAGALLSRIGGALTDLTHPGTAPARLEALAEGLDAVEAALLSLLAGQSGHQQRRYRLICQMGALRDSLALEAACGTG